MKEIEPICEKQNICGEAPSHCSQCGWPGTGVLPAGVSLVSQKGKTVRRRGLGVLFLLCAVFLWSQTASTWQSGWTLDLTAPIPVEQQGTAGIPGGHFSSNTEDNYKLPLEVRVVRSWMNEQGGVGLELTIRNIGEVPFELPASQNLTQIEKPRNKAQRVFWILIRSETHTRDINNIAGVGLGGSTSVSGSLISLAPRDSLRVLMQIRPTELNIAFRGTENKDLVARLVCQEWRLDDDHYAITTQSDDLVSGDAIKIALQDGKPTLVQR